MNFSKKTDFFYNLNEKRGKMENNCSITNSLFTKWNIGMIYICFRMKK